MRRRASGVLLHITSLPSPYGIGDVGPGAYRFVDFLVDAGQSLWQILPLNPTATVFGDSPYSSISAFAGNTLLISPDALIDEGLLTKKDVEILPSFPETRCDYPKVVFYKGEVLNRAYESFKKNEEKDFQYREFCKENSNWLDDFALFVALKENFGEKIWREWPEKLRNREPDFLQQAKHDFCERIAKHKFFQYIFFKQWFSLKKYCNQKGIQIIGDIPIYVNYDSADVWTNPEIFKLDEEKKPSVVSGVPPDYFSKTGQLWGNPIFRWDVLRQTGYAWWIRRIQHNLNLFDIARIDHFRGFIASWEVPAGERTAINGRWVETPADDFFATLLKRFPYLPIIAEDLGIITPDVREVMQKFDFPGMRVLLFAFGEDAAHHPYAPHNYVRNCVVYTGTHDNNTARGWFEKEATDEEKDRFFRYLGKETQVDEVHRELIRLAITSVANMAIVPMQDVLGLGEEARMNRPATSKGNWQWRLLPEKLKPENIQFLKEMTTMYGRA